MPAAIINQLRAGVLAAMATLVLAACGGGAATTGPGGPGATSAVAATQAPGGAQATQQPGGGTADPCALLTDADIKAVTGYTVSTKVPGPQGGVFPTGCLWELDSTEMIPPSIALGVMTQGGRAYYDTYFKQQDVAAGGTPLTGVGDEAVDVGFGTVHVVSGDAFFNLQYLGQDDHEVELAKKVVANL